MRLLESGTNTNKDINAAVSIASYTATALSAVIVRVLVNQVAGGGDYIIYATLTKSAVEYRVIPLTTATAAASLTSIGFVSTVIPMDTDDILQVYIDGLAGDTTTPDTRTDFYTYNYLQPATAGRTLVVDANGLADANTVKVGPSGSGSTQTARDLGASVLLSSGTGAGQLDFTAGVVKANLTHIIGTLLTETTPGWIATAFRKLFNVASPLLVASDAMRGTDGAYTGTPPTVGAIADQVWDEALAGHVAAGSAGKALGDAGSGSVTVNASVAISATEAENVASGRLAIRSYHSFSQVIKSTSTAALNTATKLWLAIKANEDDADSAALVLIEKTAGLTVLAGAAYTSTTHGSLVVAGSAGDWEITAALDEVATGLLHAYATSGLYAECKALVGTATIPVWDGNAAISKGIVRAVV
jgi:hypothetical protein